MSAQIGVIFDMDGVLFDTEYIAYVCWGEAAQRLGLSGWETVYPQCIGITQPKTRALWRETWGDEAAEAFEREILAVSKERFEGKPVPPKPGLLPALDALGAAGVPMAVASSTPEKRVRENLAQAGILERFSAVIGGDRLQRSKPAPDIFLLAGAALGIEPGHCFVVEDSYNGIRAAHAAGMRALMVLDLQPPTDEMRALAEAVLKDLAEASEYILQKRTDCHTSVRTGSQ